MSSHKRNPRRHNKGRHSLHAKPVVEQPELPHVADEKEELGDASTEESGTIQPTFLQYVGGMFGYGSKTAKQPADASKSDEENSSDCISVEEKDQPSPKSLLKEFENERHQWKKERNNLYQKCLKVDELLEEVTQLKRALVKRDKEIASIRSTYRSPPLVGIDFGTSNICIATVENDKVRTICNEREQPVMKNNVEFTDPKKQAHLDPVLVGVDRSYRSICCFKRLLGLDSHSATEHKLSTWQPIRQATGERYDELSIFLSNSKEPVSAVECTSVSLERLKQIAEAYFGGVCVSKAVIAIPACFNDRQRIDLVDAANLAGLKTVHLVSESLAVVEALRDLTGEEAMPKHFLIVSMGGGFTEISKWSMKNGLEFSVSERFGGEDIDDVMLNAVVALLRNKYGKFDPTFELKAKVQKAKEELSTGVSQVEISLFVGGRQVRQTLEKTWFDEIVASTFLPRFRNLLTAAIQHPTKRSREVILSGGSTRIPAIVQEIQKAMPGVKVFKGINFSEAVAHGTALLASMIEKHEKSSPHSPIRFEPAPVVYRLTFSISEKYKLNSIMEGSRDLMLVVPGKIRWKVELPPELSDGSEPAENFVISLYQSSHLLAQGCFVEPVAGNGVIHVDFDSNGLFSSSSLTVNDTEIVLKKWYEGMSRTEFHRVDAELQSYRFEVEERRRQKVTCNKLDTLIAYGEKVSLAMENEALEKMCFQWMGWYDDNCDASVAELEEKYNEIMQVFVRSNIPVPNDL